MQQTYDETMRGMLDGTVLDDHTSFDLWTDDDTARCGATIAEARYNRNSQVEELLLCMEPIQPWGSTLGQRESTDTRQFARVLPQVSANIGESNPGIRNPGDSSIGIGYDYQRAAYLGNHESCGPNNEMWGGMQSWVNPFDSQNSNFVHPGYHEYQNGIVDLNSPASSDLRSYTTTSVGFHTTHRDSTENHSSSNDRYVLEITLGMLLSTDPAHVQVGTESFIPL
jgi:hypothetical protein